MTLVVLSLALAASTAASPVAMPHATHPYTVQDLVRELPSVVVVTSSPPSYFGLDLDTTRATGPLGALARANWHYVYYLTQNAPSEPLSRETLRAGSLDAVRRKVLTRLSADTVYLTTLARSVDRWQAAAGGRAAVTGAVSAANLRVVSARRVRDIATRFFYPDAVLPGGRIQAHVCVGINGVIDLQGGRDLAVEAFVYAALFHDILRPRFDIDADFREALRQLNAMDLGTDPATRLERARGVMWAAMLRSERLHRLLAAEHDVAQAYLPFRIEPAPAGEDAGR